MSVPACNAVIQGLHGTAKQLSDTVGKLSQKVRDVEAELTQSQQRVATLSSMVSCRSLPEHNYSLHIAPLHQAFIIWIGGISRAYNSTHILLV